MAPVQAFTAWARKAPHPVGEGLPDRPGTFDFEDFKRAIQRSDIRTEYVEPLWAIRYAYPALFQVNRLALAGAIDIATAADWLEKQRYAPEVITALKSYWGTSAPAKADANVTKAHNQLWSAVHASFLAGESSATQARATLTRLGIPGTARTEILSLWTAERELIRKQLTPAQIKKAYVKRVNNPATGAPWTRDDAFAGLIERGYSANDANTFLDE